MVLTKHLKTGRKGKVIIMTKSNEVDVELMVERVERKKHGKIYISGGITGCPGYMDQFCAAERKLKALGYVVVNPAKVNGELPAETTYQQYMKMCQCMIDMCDAIFMLDGWEKSQGAKFERHYARITGKKVIE